MPVQETLPRTHCLHGHLWDENTYINGRGRRECIECRRVTSACYYSRSSLKELARLPKLRPSEWEVWKLVSCGMSDKEIAQHRRRGVRTVQTQISTLCHVFGIESSPKRTKLALMFQLRKS